MDFREILGAPADGRVTKCTMGFSPVTTELVTTGWKPVPHQHFPLARDG